MVYAIQVKTTITLKKRLMLMIVQSLSICLMASLKKACYSCSDCYTYFWFCRSFIQILTNASYIGHISTVQCYTSHGFMFLPQWVPGPNVL